MLLIINNLKKTFFEKLTNLQYGQIISLILPHKPKKLNKMKKVLFIAAVAVASLASCKKDRTCSCTTTSNAPGSTSSTSKVTYTKARKGDARAACLSSKQDFTIGNNTYTATTDCSLN